MIEVKDIEKLASLSRIKITPEEVEKFRTEIDSILLYVAQVQKVPLQKDVLPQAGVVRNVLRDDVNPHESGIHTEALLNEAPDREGNYLRVKKIL